MIWIDISQNKMNIWYIHHLWYIIRTFVHVTMYPQYNNNII
jgi:hypothetical protein